MSVECGKPLLGWQKDKDLDMKMYASKRHCSRAITASVPWGMRSTAPTLWNLCTSVTYPLLSHKSEASSFTEETSVSWDARNLKPHLSKLQGQSWYLFSWQEKWRLQYSKSPESSISLQHWYEQEHHERNSHITDELPIMNIQKTNQIPEGEHENTQLVRGEILLQCTDSKKTTQFRNRHLYRVPTELNEIKANMPATTGRNQRWCHKEHMLLKQGNIACHLIKGMYTPNNIFHFAPRSAPSSGTLIRVCSSAHKVNLPPLIICSWHLWLTSLMWV